MYTVTFGMPVLVMLLTLPQPMAQARVFPAPKSISASDIWHADGSVTAK